MVSYKPLGDSEAHIFQFLVTLDVSEATILVDCGWDETLSKETLSAIVEAIPQIDFILLTHGTLSHTGAFAYLRNRYPQFRSIPAYATLPVVRMSQLMTLELYQNAGLCGSFDNEDAMSVAEVEAIWSEVNNVKYSQPLRLHSNPKLDGIVITAYNGGHSLGGSLWKIDDRIDSIVIALEWNHARDAHLNGAFLEQKTGTVVPDLQKPSVLITSTDVSSGQPLTKARQTFLSYVDEAIKLGGNVLIPTSSGSRVLELILVLKKHMTEHQKDVPLIYCNTYGEQSLTQASSMLEWMVPSIIGDWQVRNESPFDSRRIHYAADIAELRNKWPSGPKVILASGECLESGPSRELFLELIAGDSTSSVILNELCPKKSLGSELLKRMKEDTFSRLNTRFAKLESMVREPLSGDRLTEYNSKRETAREEAEQAAALEKKNQQLIDTSAQAGEDLSDSDNEDEDYTHPGRGATVLLQPGGPCDYECPDPRSYSDLVYYMFPFKAKRTRVDEYGQYIPSFILTDKPPEAQKRKETKDDSDEHLESAADGSEEEKAKDASGTGREQEHDHPMTIVKSLRRNVKVVCNIAYADMNGITNLRSLLMVVKQIQPSKTIAMPGNKEVCEYLKKQCQDMEVGSKPIQFARRNFSVDVRLDPSIKLEWHKLIGDYSVARVSGILEIDPHDRLRRSGAVLVSPNPLNGDTREVETEDRKPIVIGDLRLTVLRSRLIEAGMKAEFKDQGILVCNDQVLVRKTGAGSYTLEGSIGEDYYAVRRAIRQFIATI